MTFIGSLLFSALLKSLSDTSKSAKKISSSLDVVTIRGRLTDSVSCRETFKGLGAPPNPCAVGNYVDLRSENGAIVVPAAGGKIGDWTVRARCVAGGLDVRAAKLSPGATGTALDFTAPYVANKFVADEMGGQNAAAGNRPLRYDWDHPKGRLFTAGTNGICADWFAPSAAPVGANCPDGHYMTGVNFMMRTPICTPVPVCTGANALTFDGSVFRCSDEVIKRVVTTETKLKALGGSGKTTDVTGGDEDECGEVEKISCPSGSLAIGWSAWVSNSNITKCRVRCIKMGP